MEENVPLVVIAGRANVGKSTLFNRLSRRRSSIVDAVPGVTRDILENRVELNGVRCRLVDTGGIELAGTLAEPLQRAAEEKAWDVLSRADLVLLVIDGRVEITSVEHDLILRLRKEHRSVLLVINKREGVTHQEPPPDIYTFGFEDIVQISASHGDGIGLLKEIVAHRVGQAKPAAADDDRSRFRLAILGKPNVGKSTLFNAFLGEGRSLVSPIPGTTRDAIESRMDHDTGAFTLIDTAGVARKSSPRGDIAFYAAIRTWKNLKDGQICLLVVDLPSGITRQDKRIAQEITQSRKGCLVFLNKLDIWQSAHPIHSPDELIRESRQELSFPEYALFQCGSALDPVTPGRLLPLILKIAEGYFRKIPTGLLNHSIKEPINDFGWTLSSGKPFRVYYAYQEFTAPPRLRFLTNFTGSVEQRDALARKIGRLIRTKTDWEGVPLSIEIVN